MCKREWVKLRPKTNVQIPSAMWNAFDVEDLLLTLAYFAQARSLHRKPIIYNCGRKELAKRLNISYNTFKFHFRILEAKGLVTFEHGHVRFMTKGNMAKLYPSKTKILTLRVDSDVKITKAVVKGVKIVSTFRQSKKIIAREVKKNKYIRESHFRRLSSKKQKAMQKEAKLDRKTYAGYITMSNKTIASKVGCSSPTTGRKYKNILKKMGIIDYRRRFERIHEKDISKYYDGSFGFLNGARCYNNILFREVTCQFRIGKDEYETFQEFGKTYSFSEICALSIDSLKPANNLRRKNIRQRFDTEVDLSNVPF